MTSQAQIETLARSKLLGNRVDPVGFVDELLLLARGEGEIQCKCANDDALRFVLSSAQAVFDVPGDDARGKLRMMCARLAKLCEENGQEFLPYGGEGLIEKVVPCSAVPDGQIRAAQGGRGDGSVGAAVTAEIAPRREQWTVRYKNTMHE